MLLVNLLQMVKRTSTANFDHDRTGVRESNYTGEACKKSENTQHFTVFFCLRGFIIERWKSVLQLV